MVAPEDHPIHDKPIPEYTREEMNVPEVRESLQKKLTPLELQMFEDWRLDFARWTFDRGKKERRGEGYSYRSMRDIINRVERFCEWLYIGKEVGKDGDIDEVIESEEGESFTVNFTPEHLNRYWYHLETNGNRTDSNRRTVNNVSLVLKHQRKEWKIPNSEEVYEDIHREEKDAAFKDWFRDYELKNIKSASLRHNIIDRGQLNEEEWNERAVYLSQALGKPKYALSDADWDNTVSWKIPSLVYISCDLGFRPCDIEDSRVQWFDTENENDAHLSLPREEDSKAGKRNRSGKISAEAARVFNYWLEERQEDPVYEDTDAVWLNQKNKPYSARSLRYHLMNLQRVAGMNVEERENGWYMIRRGVGTDIINKEGDIITLMHQLRINRYETAMRYVMTADQAADRYFNRR